MNSEHPGSHVFQQTGTIFVHIQGIITTNVLTKFHEDWKINVTFKSVNKKIPPPPDNKCGLYIVKNDTPPDGHFHEDRTINVAPRVLTIKNALSPGGHVFQSTRTIFELVQDIIGKNLLTKFHDDRTINGASRVLTRFTIAIHVGKNATPPLWKNTLPWF
ncbi:hypothetical protein DPMN_011253 [Dreissena polymorpha]|uniref:Uncharacterized protein n=1 Tax=Dreissena polymorpha TaxID=45954 RepID=A0A9D4S2A9_DREPO|nr:hypothetical protein DPMN_011253 [Dreissena polymorpha]